MEYDDIIKESYDFADEIYNKKDLKNSFVSRHYQRGKAKIAKTIIKDENNPYGKEKGTYLSIELENIDDSDDYDNYKKVLSSHLASLIKSNIIKKKPFILVVGLGNEDYAPDALGPRVIKKMNATSHLMSFKDLEVKTKVACLIPGVMALTGLESASIIQSVIKEFNIDLVIAIDSLASRNLSRLNKVIQITDTGIAPGGGVNNYRRALNKKELDVPVIALGVATVVSSTAILYQALQKLRDEMSIDYDKEVLKDIFSSFGQDLVLTTKEIDQRIEILTSLIADSLNMTLNPSLYR